MTAIGVLHEKEYGVKPDICVSVPSVITPIGLFSECCKGNSVSGTLDRTADMSFSLNNSGNVRVFNNYLNDRKHFTAIKPKYRKEDHWANYIKGIIAEVRTFPGMDITVSGSLLGNDSMSVSAALSLGTAVALKELFKLKWSAQGIIDMCYKSISDFSFGMCRMSDLVTMYASVPGNLVYFDYTKMDSRLFPFPFGQDEDIVNLIISSNIKSSEFVEEQFSLLNQAAETFARLDEINRKVYDSTDLSDFPLNDLKSRAVNIDERSRHIAIYVLSANRALQQLEKDLKARNYLNIGRSFTKLQQDVSDHLMLSSPEIDWLAKRARETEGCFGATIVYTGRPGDLIMLCRRSSVEKYIEKISEYEHIFGAKPSVEVYLPAGGVRVSH